MFKVTVTKADSEYNSGFDVRSKLIMYKVEGRWYTEQEEIKKEYRFCSKFCMLDFLTHNGVEKPQPDLSFARNSDNLITLYHIKYFPDNTVAPYKCEWFDDSVC